ncbi:Octicosapeptide/Phox/Bem1p family protein [Trifolium repens]|nr:Octicosapeptide/Phox/Bem1p family protein [Trifolium repens]
MESKSKPLNAIKILYSYGGKILPRSTDGELRYVGGHTRVLSVDLSISFSELIVKLEELCGSSAKLRCQLPNGDLETLISITNDEDLANIINEYERVSLKLTHPLKIRAILLQPKSLVKVSSDPSSASSSASRSPSRSPHTSAESLPYAVAYRIGRHSRSPRAPFGYSFGVKNGSAKACCNMGQFGGSPRSLYYGPRCNNYCH